MSKIRTLLVDDEPLAIRGLTIRLEALVTLRSLVVARMDVRR